VSANKPSKRFGKNVIILEGMHDVAANEFPILFGSLKGYQIWDRSRATLKVLEEVYASGSVHEI
jgi:HK97 family phage major capsid protein